MGAYARDSHPNFIWVTSGSNVNVPSIFVKQNTSSYASVHMKAQCLYSVGSTSEVHCCNTGVSDETDGAEVLKLVSVWFLLCNKQAECLQCKNSDQKCTTYV